jgi:hypothetical protein
MLCPVCHNICTKKFTKKGIPLGISCEIITSSTYYHRFIYYSENDFMLAIYYPLQQGENCLIVGVHPTPTSNKYVFAVKNKTLEIHEFSSCSSMEILHKYLNMSLFL